MSLVWLIVGAIVLWALIRLGRLGETAGQGHWRISATIMGAALLAGAIFAGSKGGWLVASVMASAGLYLITASRIRHDGKRAVPTPGAGEAMSEAEARAILGVDADASVQAIQLAWRRVMARAHPDQGGTEGLAARVNAARDRLLKTSAENVR